jgi:hypothetical protein
MSRIKQRFVEEGLERALTVRLRRGIEIGVMVGQRLDRRIPDLATLVAEVAAWEQRRNNEGARIEWMFTVERARLKLGRAYPTLPAHAMAV